MPLFPETRPSQVLSNPTPSDVRPPLRDVLHRVADGLDLLGVLVGDRDLELVLELHHEFDRVERVRAEVVDERRLRRDLVGLVPI
jgi:hypothetical protein